ncbi:hypothetical protein B0T22DRAFT_215410 [Podospora appendiculata]|uniref:Uncharacterized protein n=1 Tax=Podospora appendiculata TaxID=314037 RepID=A0AAE0X591_9PEZI|nr:hypothetical protein B0T22DRAFT_215410 [Podospora appendiculata]
MCGHESITPAAPRVGARVDFFSASQGPLGNLIFLDPSTPAGPLATHVRFSPRAGVVPLDDGVLVSIHVTGDLTKSIRDSGLFRQFTLHRVGSRSGKDQPFDMTLDNSLSLNVGHDGIIGRRVSIVAGGELLADGIVGFNTPPSPSS